jgi:hypothetical protein
VNLFKIDAVKAVLFFFLEKGLAADATDARQPCGLLCNPYNEDEEKDD